MSIIFLVAISSVVTGGAAAAIAPAAERFGSITASKVNVRKGPGKEYSIIMEFNLKTIMPVQILREVEDWSMIRDDGGREGWVRSRFVSSSVKKRSCVTKNGGATLCRLPHNRVTGGGCEKIAILDQGISMRVLQCGAGWCRVQESTRLTGWVRKSDIWGIGSREKFG